MANTGESKKQSCLIIHL